MSKLLELSRKINHLSYARISKKFFDDFTFGDDFYSKQTDREKNLENIRSVASIEGKARELLKNLVASRSVRVSLIHLERLVAYLKKYHVARERVFKDDGIAHLLKIFHSIKDVETRKQTRLALALLGYVDPVKGKGVRILSLDGGGTRGVMTIRILREISERCQQPIHELFDLIIGTSTGAILAVLLGVQQQTLSKCELLYDKLSSEIFQGRSLMGTTQLLFNHAYYDTQKLETILKDECGVKQVMIDSSAYKGPKVAAVSTLVNHQQLQAYIFRNYCLQSESKSFYTGSSKHKFWEAIRASTAAPGFFEEMMLDDGIYQDGGLLSNNPTAIAIHEAKALWPNTPIQAVVSVGTGSYHGRAGPESPNFTTLKDKLKKLVYSATDVESTHVILKDLLNPSMYIRLNPNMSADIPLDVCDAASFDQLEHDTYNYINKFSYKFDTTVRALLHQKNFYDKVTDEITYWRHRKRWH